MTLTLDYKYYNYKYKLPLFLRAKEQKALKAPRTLSSWAEGAWLVEFAK